MTLSIANLLTIAGLTIAAAGLAITAGRGIMSFGAMRQELKETREALEKFGVNFAPLLCLPPKVEQHDKDIVSLQKAMRNGLAAETRHNTQEIEVIKGVCRERHGHDVFTREVNHG